MYRTKFRHLCQIMSICVYVKRNSKLAFIYKKYQKLNSLLFHYIHLCIFTYLVNPLLSLLGYTIVHFFVFIFLILLYLNLKVAMKHHFTYIELPKINKQVNMLVEM